MQFGTIHDLKVLGRNNLQGQKLGSLTTHRHSSFWKVASTELHLQVRAVGKKDDKS